MIHWGLIGHPVAHSFSKQFFQDKFIRLGWRDARYDLFDIEHVSQVIALLKQHPELSGLNVTIPHKQVVLEWCDELSEEVLSIGAVNCIRIHRSNEACKLIGYNTDAFGFERALGGWWKGTGKSVLVLGTGGSSRAVCYVLQRLGFDVQLASSTKKEAALSYEDLKQQSLKQYQLIVNCTPLGMHPNTDTCPLLDYGQLTSDHYLFDLVYNPQKTLFLKHGVNAGARVQNGLRMLHLQAEKSWEIWTKP